MIRLKKNADKRIRKGHLWVFSNEIDSPSVSEIVQGEVDELFDHSGKFLGMVYSNPRSLITSRVLSHKRTDIDGLFVKQRIKEANDRRSSICRHSTAYRLFYGESDLIPGLIIDKYADAYVVQSSTAGVDTLMELVVQAIVELFSPSCVYIRNDLPVRDLEGISRTKKLAYGTLPERIEVELNGLKFLVDIENGQKTGLFLDQEFNRTALIKYLSPQANVLDLFCYTGAWGINAAARGLCGVTAVDSSANALDAAKVNAELNNVGDRFEVVKSDCIDFLKKMEKHWDVVIADPPAYIKSKAKLAEGKRGYFDLNKRALGKLRKGGLLITCSCSHHLSLEEFRDLILSASLQSSRRIRLLEVLGQGPDHPCLPAMPETSYLKALVCQVM